MKYELSRTEEQIMDFLWTNNRPVKTGEIMDYFTENKGKEWKRQTLNTLLIRLEEKMCIRDSPFKNMSLTQEKGII